MVSQRKSHATNMAQQVRMSVSTSQMQVRGVQIHSTKTGCRAFLGVGKWYTEQESVLASDSFVFLATLPYRTWKWYFCCIISSIPF